MFSKALLLSALVGLSVANPAPAPQPQDDSSPLPQGLQDISADQERSLISALESFQDSLTADPTFSSVVNYIATAVPTDQLEESGEDPVNYFKNIATGSTPGWIASLPTQYKSYLSSIAEDETKLISSVVGDGNQSGGSQAAMTMTGNTAMATGTNGAAATTGAMGTAAASGSSSSAMGSSMSSSMSSSSSSGSSSSASASASASGSSGSDATGLKASMVAVVALAGAVALMATLL